MRTFIQALLSAETFDIIHDEVVPPIISECWFFRGFCIFCIKPHHSADNFGIIVIPFIVTESKIRYQNISLFLVYWPYWSPFVEYFSWLIVRATSQKQINLIFWNYWWHHVLYIMYIFYIPYQSKLLQRPLQPYSHGNIYWNNTPVSFLIPRNEHHPWCKKFPCHQRYFFLWPWPMRYPVPNSYTPPLHHCHPNSHHWNRMVITSNVWCQWSSFDFTRLVFHYKVLLLVVCWLRQLIVILCSKLDLVLNILLCLR